MMKTPNTTTVLFLVLSTLLAAGAIVSITGDVGDDIRAAAASVSVAGNVTDDAVVAAGSYLSMVIAAVILFLIFPRSSAQVVEQLQRAPIKSLALGMTVLIMTPIMALILLFSVPGLPPGLTGLTTYFAVLIAGLLVGIAWIGDRGFRALDKDPDL